MLAFAGMALLFALSALYPAQMADYFLGSRLKKRGIAVNDPQLLRFMRFIGIVGACFCTLVIVKIGLAWVGLLKT